MKRITGLLLAGVLVVPPFVVLEGCSPKVGCPTGYGCMPRGTYRKMARNFHGGWSDYGNSYTSRKNVRKLSGGRYRRGGASSVSARRRYARATRNYSRRMQGAMFAQRSYRKMYSRPPMRMDRAQVRRRKYPYTRGTPFAQERKRRQNVQYKSRTKELFRKKEKQRIGIRY